MLPQTGIEHGEPLIQDTQQTACCVVGSGPGGAMLSLLLARKGVPVILLEEHKDFERDFRGDTIHPSVMQILDEIGLADRLLQLRHAKIPRLNLKTSAGPVTAANFSRLKTKYPYITMIPQETFLEFITGEAKRYPNFKLIMGANVRRLVQENGEVRGVRYMAEDGWHEVRALLTVGADGRFSRVRRLAGFEPLKTSPPMDVVWFRLPREPADSEETSGRLGDGLILGIINRFDYWQIGYIIPKGSYQQLRSKGLEALRESITELAPEFADRVEYLRDWRQVSLLSVESSRLPRWYRPGLLLIGDAAHTMSPVGGVGINYAIQDAVVAANILAEPLKAGQVRLSHLAAVQRRREWPTRIIQMFQTLVQRRVLAGALKTGQAFRPPAPVRILGKVPFLRSLPARLIAFGVWPVHVKD